MSICVCVYVCVRSQKWVSDFEQLSRMTWDVHLSGNNLVGCIPNTLGVALGPSLQYLDLASNMLRGELPTTLLGGMPRLHTLYIEPKLDGNATWALTGSLPPAMGTATGLPNLRYLGMYARVRKRGYTQV